MDGLVALYEEVAAEGRWIGGEYPIDHDARRSAFRRIIGATDSEMFVAEADPVASRQILRGARLRGDFTVRQLDSSLAPNGRR